MPDPKALEEVPDATDLAYEAPPEPIDEGEDEGGGGPRGRGSPSLKVAIAAVVVLLVGAALLAYRSHHRGKVVAAALAQADVLLRLDTAAGYRKAATLLEPIAQLDPIQGGSVRAFALAMLFADYRENGAEAEVDELLVAPGRAEAVPAHAQLAAAALALGRREAGTAVTAAGRAGRGPWPLAMEARIALLAGNVEAALAPASAAAAEGAFPAGLALHGDVLRRLRKSAAAARAAYQAALAASPAHPRASYGLAKLALSGQAPISEAEEAVRRLAGDSETTPAPERARAALYLAALRLREGDRAAATSALDAAGLDASARAWAARAAAVLAEHRGPYRAVTGAPAGVQSASDDDPGELSPTAPSPAPAPVAAAKPTRSAKKAAAPKHGASKKASAAKRASATKKASSAKKGAAKRPAAKRATTRR